MAVSQVATINTKDEVLNRIMAGLQAKLNPVLKSPVLNGALVTVFIATGAPVDVDHGLSRQPLGWIVVDQTANSNIWRSAWDKSVLTLNSSADVTVTLWVF